MILRARRLAAVGIAAAALVATWPAARGACAQTLDLGGVRAGPTIGERNGAVDLADSLEAEARELTAQAAELTGEAKLAREAGVRVRTLAAYLLRAGATRPWNESALTVDGARLAMLVGRTDAMIDTVLTRGVDWSGRKLSSDEMARAMQLVDAFAKSPLDAVRKANGAASDRLAAELAQALRVVLAPLVELARMVEGAQNDDPWPVLADSRGDARAGDALRARATDDARSVLARIGAMPDMPEKAALQRAIELLLARPIAALHEDARLIGDAADGVAWLGAMRAAGAPLAMPAPAIEAAMQRIVSAVTVVAGAPESDVDARRTLESLDVTLAAARAMLAMRNDEFSGNDAARAALSDAAASLLAADAAGATAERDRVRAARRISDACATAQALLDDDKSAQAPGKAAKPGKPADSPATSRELKRDLNDALRQFDRDARFAVRALPSAFKAIAADPSAGAMPANLSALERVRSLEADRRRLRALQGFIDQIGSVRPASARAFAGVARRMARMMLDPLKRDDAQNAFRAIESQFALAFPLPFEDELKRGTPRARELTGGEAIKVWERASALRGAWCDALGRGDFGGPEAQAMDAAARLCACLRAIDTVGQPIDRAGGDRLSMWGGWATRRAMLAPAAQDLVALAALASRSFVQAQSVEGARMFERDLAALESAVPLVRLTAALDARLAPIVRGTPETLGAQLAPLVVVPAGNAYLAAEWPRLLAMHRAMFELEFARRTADGDARKALSAYLAEVARDLERAAFGDARQVARVPGFDGSAAGTDDDRAPNSQTPRKREPLPSAP